LGEEKDKIWAQIRARALKEEKKEIRKKKIEKIKLFLKKKIQEIIEKIKLFFKKFKK